MWKWFKENILRIRPVFKIKIEKSSFSSDYFCIKFSKNNGWKWYYIIDETTDIDSPCNELTAKVRYFRNESVKAFVEKLHTFQDCFDHNCKVYENIKRTNEDRISRYIKERESTKKFIKEFNNK